MSTADPSKAHQAIANWLLLLARPGQFMEFSIAEMGVKPKSARNYVHNANMAGPRRYRARISSDRARLVVQRLTDVSPGGE